MLMTAEELLTELHLLASAQKPAAILLVEGESDRKLFLQLFRDPEKFLLIAAGSQSLVIGTMAALAATVGSLPPTKGVIDRDYLIPLQKAPAGSSVVMSDLRDIECMMIQSRAFEAVMREFLDLGKASKLGLRTVADIKAAAINICKQVGFVRFWSQHAGKNLSFKSLDYSKFISKDKPNAINVRSFLRHLQGAQKGVSVSESDIKDAKDLCATQKYFTNDLLICRGHDLMAVLAIVLKKWCGNSSCSSIEADQLEKMFRVAFPVDWARYKLVQDLKSWVTSSGLSAHLA